MSNEKEHFYTGVRDPALEALFAQTLPQLAEDVRALNNRRLTGLWLGGGYGRGEGGAFYAEGQPPRPYNDIDLFVFTEDMDEDQKDDLEKSLKPIAEKYSAAFGASVDFCRPRNPPDYKKDEDRLMIQELKRGHVALLGGDGLLDHVRLLEAEELPRMEAMRLLMNRGMGLVFAAQKYHSLNVPENRTFFIRNLNKAILGAGDAQLLAAGRYAWTLAERVARLNDPDYEAAAAFKLRPSDVLAAPPAALWRRTRDYWRSTVRLVGFTERRSIRQMMRWIVRRRTLGLVGTLGQDCTERVLRRVSAVLMHDIDGCQLSPELEQDWLTFN